MLCRLCVKESLCFLNIFDSDGVKLDIAEIIGRHFWFKPRADDRMTLAICTMCWAKVYNFHQFYLAVEEAHSKLSATNVEKEIVGEYVWNEFINKDVAVKGELTFSAIEEENVFAGPKFFEIDVNAKEFLETPSSRKLNESMELEFIKVGGNDIEFQGDSCLNGAVQNDQKNQLTELVSEIIVSDNLNEECDKLNIEGVVDSNSFADDPSLCCTRSSSLLPKNSTQTVKNRKRLITTEKRNTKLRANCKEKNKTCADTSLSYSQKTAKLVKKSTETVKSQTRLTRAQVKLTKLREKRAMSEKNKESSNDDAQGPVLEKSIEPITDTNFSNCTFTSKKSTEPSLSNFGELETKKKSTKSKNRKIRLVSQKTAENRKIRLVSQKTAELRRKRGLESSCSDEELVKNYIHMSCDDCDFVCDEFENLKNHYRTDHPNIKPYVKCCNRKWLHWLSIVDHAYKHHNPELLKCQECQKDFNELVTLSRHIIQFHEQENKVFSCELCSKKFLRKKRLEIHRTLHIPMNERKFICDQCPDYRFGCEALLRAHIRKIHRRPYYVCHVCGKEMKTKISFDKHVRFHFEERGPKIQCTFEGCESWLKDNDGLRLHIHRHHTNRKERVFTCEVCGGEYKNRAAMSSHMLGVHPKKTYPCDVCNKVFKRAWSLREHMAQHTGERNYKCFFCTSTFNTNGNYYTHLKNLHAVEYESWRKENIKTGTKSLLRLNN